MNAKIGLSALARVNHPYPTLAQAIKMAADAYLATRHTPNPQMATKAMAVPLKSPLFLIRNPGPFDFAQGRLRRRSSWAFVNLSRASGANL